MQVAIPKVGISLDVAGICQCIKAGATFQEYWHPAKKLKPTLNAQDTLNISTQTWYRGIFQLERDARETELQNIVQGSKDALQSLINDFPGQDEQRRVTQVVQGAAAGHYLVDTENNRTLLHYLAMNGVHDLIRQFVLAGFSVEAPDSDRRTPLHLAAIGCHFEAVKALVESRANVHSRDLNRCIPWDYACSIDLSREFEQSKEVEQTNILHYLALLTDCDQLGSRRSKRMHERMKDPNSSLDYS